MSIQEEILTILIDNQKNNNEWIKWHDLCKYYNKNYDGRITEERIKILKSLKTSISGVKRRLKYRGKILVKFREMNSRGNYKEIVAIRIFQKGDEKWIAADFQLNRNMRVSLEKSYNAQLKILKDIPGIDIGIFNAELKALDSVNN